MAFNGAAYYSGCTPQYGTPFKMEPSAPRLAGLHPLAAAAILGANQVPFGDPNAPFGVARQPAAEERKFWVPTHPKTDAFWAEFNASSQDSEKNK
jgi:hypothetical protein